MAARFLWSLCLVLALLLPPGGKALYPQEEPHVPPFVPRFD